MMDEQVLREIAIEMQEMEADFQKRMEALRRKLRIALGDVKPRPKVTEFVGWDGRSTTVGRGKKK